MWGATLLLFFGFFGFFYFNPRSPCGERPALEAALHRAFDFNPRSPCGERPSNLALSPSLLIFQSTLPVWGATRRAPSTIIPLCYFNPRSPCGERHWGLMIMSRRTKHFNPRSPCGERPTQRSDMFEQFNFNPRSPCGERPYFCW